MSKHRRGTGQDPDNDWFYLLFDVPADKKVPFFSYLIFELLIIALIWVILSAF